MEYYFINEIKELKDKINCYDKEIRNLNCKIDKVVDSLAWFIPFRKKRDEFRNKFNDNFIWGGDQEYWTHDENWDNVIPKNWGEFPEGFNVIDFLREITKELDFKRVLDFGCGYGRLSKAFDSDKYVGVDLNLKALKVARKNNPQYRYEDIFINSKNYPDSDLVNAFGVFLHLNDEDFEEALIKLSKNNRYIIISEVMGREWRRDGLPPVFCRDKEEYIKYLNKYGFELYKEYDKPYKRYIEDKNWDDKKNRNISFLIFRKY